MQIETPQKGEPLVMAWLGAPLISYGERLLTFRTRKAVALLVYLTTEKGLHTREKLTALFWPESDTARGRGMLRTSLAHLRQVLDVIEPPCLIAEPQTLAFNFNSNFELDLHQLQAALEIGQRSPTPAQRGRVIDQLQWAVNHFRGDFLDGFTLADAPAFDDWVTLQREIWHSRMSQVFDTLSQWQFEVGDLPTALETATRWRAHDLYGEAAPQRLMQLQFANGNRATALQLYDEHLRMLATEFGGKPSAALESLAARIRAGSPLRQVGEQSSPILTPTDLTFVGRAEEFTHLKALYGGVRQGRPQIAILTGEAGIGKTRLAAEFLQWATAQGTDILATRAFETGGELPYQPLVQLFRQRLDQERELTDLLSPTWLAELSRLLPEVRDRYPHLPLLQPDEATAQSRLLESITRLGQALAERAPIVLFIDDIQWADMPSLDALHYAMLRWMEHKSPILLILCSRDISINENSNLLHWLTSIRAKLAVTQLMLAPLTVEDTLALVLALDSGPSNGNPLSETEQEQGAGKNSQSATSPLSSKFEAFAQALYDETGGQTLYVVETIKSLLEQKVLIPYPSDGGSIVLQWKTLEGETAGHFSLPRIIPSSVRVAILDRLSRLTTTAMAMLTAAAVLGQAATFQQLTAVSGSEQMAGLDALEELVAKRLLLASGKVEQLYLIAHDKIRDVIYSESSAVRKKVLHSRAVIALRDGDPARLAYHALAAGMDAEAFEYSGIAGDAALHLFAAGEAITHYEIARKIFMAGELPQVDLEKVRHLYINLGRGLELNAQFEQAGVVYEELQTIAQHRSAPALELDALTAQVILRSILSDTFDPLQGETLAQEALALARQLQDRAAEARILWGVMSFHISAYRLDEAILYGEEALALARDLDLREQTAYILNDMMRCHLIGGRMDLAQQAQREAIELWRQLNNLPMLAESLAGATSIARWVGNYDLALNLAAEAESISRSIDNRWGLAYSNLAIGYIYWERGQPQMTLSLLRESIRLAEVANSLMPQVIARTEYGATMASLGAFQQGLEIIQEALTIATARLPMLRPYVLGLMARVILRSGRLTEADVYIQQGKKEIKPHLFSFLNQWLFLAEAELAYRQGEYERALITTDAILEASLQSGMRGVRPAVQFVRGQCVAKLGKKDAALEILWAAYGEAEAIGSHRMMMQITLLLADLVTDPIQAQQLEQQAQTFIAYMQSNTPLEMHDIFNDMLQEEEIIQE